MLLWLFGPRRRYIKALTKCKEDDSWRSRPCDLESVCASVLHIARRKLFARDHCILLTHYPAEIPQSCTEPQFHCLHDLVIVLKPLVIVQGHLHALFGTQWLSPSGSLVINPGPTGGTLSIDLLRRQ